MSVVPSPQGVEPSSVLERIRRSAAAVTRYPLDVLTAEALLEDDLGIDSVKLAELAAAVGREFGLSPERLPRGAKARSLGAIAEVVTGLLGAATPVQAPVVEKAPVIEQAPVVAKAPVAPSVGADLEPRVRAVVARVTRYPEELLTAEADFEDELGIDSVKQAEILAALSQELGLPKSPGGSQRPRNIAAVCSAARALLAPVAKPAPVVAPAPVPEPVAVPVPREVIVPAFPPLRSVPAPAPLPFAGKIALVTGSGKGIGKVIATRLARAGATVVVNSFHSPDEGEKTRQEIVAAGGKAIHVWGSVAHDEHLDRMFATIGEQLGALDFVVCNASNGMIGRFDQLTPRDWDKAFRTCVTGTYECAMRARPLLARRGGGSIVTMSTSVSQRYVRDLGCQGVVKAAVESLTRYLAAELAPEGIRANCVSAGPVHGEPLSSFPEAAGRIARWEAATPGKQLCTAEDVADVTELLLGAKTQRVNGAIWVVDGGFSGTVDGIVPVAPELTEQFPGLLSRGHTNGHAARALLAREP